MVGLIPTFSVSQQMELIYIGYFNRAADATGYNFWNNQNSIAQAHGSSAENALKNIANSFAPQSETAALYPLLASGVVQGASAQAQIKAFVDAAYQNLFNRTADAGGEAYWVNQIATGQIALGSAVLAIANGAVGQDATTIINKVTVALEFTQQTAIAGMPVDSTLLSIAHLVLQGVDGIALNDASVASAKLFIQQYASAPPNNPPVLVGLPFVVGVNQSILASDTFVAFDNDAGDRITQYSFLDPVVGGAHLTFNGAKISENQWFTVGADQLPLVRLVGAPSTFSPTDTFFVTATDTHGATSQTNLTIITS